MIRYNEQKRITLTSTMLNTAGFTADEQKNVDSAVVNRNVDSDNNCSFSMSIGQRGEWSINVSGTLPEDSLDTVFNKLMSVTLHSLRGTLGQDVVAPTPVDSGEDVSA